MPGTAQPATAVTSTTTRTVLTALLSALALLAGLLAVTSDATASGRGEPRPTVVLVHGAFADASGWDAVTERLQRRGYTVYAPANPLRGLTSDAAYLRGFLDTLDGPIVLVGHSYGGAVITNAATGDPDVVALVYVAAFAPAEGETVQAAIGLGGGHSDLLENIVTRAVPGAPEDPDVYVNPASFRRIFAQDLPRRQAAVMAASQRPAAFSGFATPSGVPAWQSIPSWYLVASQDNLIPPVAERAMAARAGATTVEVDSSHVAMISRPRVVTDLILDAAGA
jgi:pimeloyl-ACP methyl ester carboxylesterase